MKPHLALLAGSLLAACTPMENPSAAPGQSGGSHAATSIPAKFRGTWTTNRSGKPSGETPTQIGPNTWRGHESAGRVQAVRILGDNEVTVTLAMDGEGEVWTETRTLRLSPDGNVLVTGGAPGQSGAMLYRVR